MALRDYFIHQCTVQETTTSRGASGQVIDTWSDKTELIDEPCRLLTKEERIASPEGLMVVTTYTLLVTAGLSITTADRIRVVTLEDGSELGPFRISSVLPRTGRKAQHHMALLLKVVD